jgi:hypothetical protein
MMVSRLHCKRWRCGRCGKKRAALYRSRIGVASETYRLQRFLTLHLDPEKIQGEPVAYLRGCFARLRTRWLRRYGEAPRYICVLEFQKNGNPHLHLLVDRFMWWQTILADWQEVGGGGFWINRVEFKDQHRVRGYITKAGYMTKDSCAAAAPGTRKVTASAGIELLGQSKECEWKAWVMHRCSIEEMRGNYSEPGVEERYELPSGLLEKFFVPAWNGGP